VTRATDKPDVGERPGERALRVALFVVLAVAVALAIWALTEGGERNLWIDAASGLDAARGRV